MLDQFFNLEIILFGVMLFHCVTPLDLLQQYIIRVTAGPDDVWLNTSSKQFLIRVTYFIEMLVFIF